MPKLRVGSTTRTETAQLTASGAATNAALGASVATDATTTVAGGPSSAGATRAAGGVYTFARTGARDRTETAQLTDPDGAPGDLLAQSVAINAGTIVTGSPGDEVGTNLAQGSATVFFQGLASPHPRHPAPPPPTKLALSKLTLSPATFRTEASPRPGPPLAARNHDPLQALEDRSG